MSTLQINTGWFWCHTFMCPNQGRARRLLRPGGPINGDCPVCGMPMELNPPKEADVQLKANMPTEVETLLTMLGVDPNRVAEVDIHCTALDKPDISIKLMPTVGEITIEVVGGAHDPV